jgi:hypothetical protein
MIKILSLILNGSSENVDVAPYGGLQVNFNFNVELSVAGSCFYPRLGRQGDND